MDFFNKAIEHDWFAEVEDLGRQYLKTDPDGPVKALAQIIQTMARAQAGRYDEASPEQCRQMSDALPDGRFRLFEQSSHVAFYEQREEYMECMRAFLHEHDSL